MSSEGLIGAAEGTRTPDPLITNEVLYQLSYRGVLTGLITICGQNRKDVTAGSNPATRGTPRRPVRFRTA